MKTITDNFKIIVAEQKKLGYNLPSILQAPAGFDEIEKTEITLGFKFSDELRELYSFANGTSIDYNSPLGLLGLIPCYIFRSLSDATYNYNTYQPFPDLYFTIWGTNYKPGIKIFPFLDDSSGECYWVDLNESSENYNKIFWTNTFPDSPAYTFSSLTSMFECIAECYSSDAMFLDEEGYLNCDYKKWGLISEKHNPGLKFWGDFKKGL